MLLSGNVPREFRDYVRLLRHIGFDAEWKRIDANVPRDNPHAMKYYEYLRAVHQKAPSVVKAEC